MRTTLKIVFYAAVVPLEVLVVIAVAQWIMRRIQRRHWDYRFRKHATMARWLDDLPNRCYVAGT